MRSDVENKTAKKFLTLLLAVDGIFILLHLLHKFTALVPYDDFSITTDWSYGELFQYIKELWVAILLVSLAKSSRCLLYFCWAAVFLLLMADDCLLLRETLSPRIGEFLGLRPMLGLRTQDIGELIAAAIFGIPSLIVLGVVHYPSDSVSRAISMRLFILLGLLIVFGVMIDMLPVPVKHGSSPLCPLVGTVEDGGEMVVMSFICSFVFSLSPDKVTGESESECNRGPCS